MPANNTTVLSDKPENTTLGVIIPIRPRVIAPPREVIAQGRLRFVPQYPYIIISLQRNALIVLDEI